MSHYIIQLIVPRDNVLFPKQRAIISTRKWTVVMTTHSRHPRTGLKIHDDTYR